jgi:hypothetical protein
MTSNEALIRDLSAGLAPVKRRRASREAALLVALGAAELVLLLGAGLMRPDMGGMLASPYMLWKLGGLALLATAGSALAIRSFSPTARPRRGLMTLVGLAAAVIIGGAFVAPAGETGRTLLDRLSPAEGIVCALSIVVVAMPMMAMLGVLMRRAAPTHPEASALAVGFAASTCSAFIFAFCCRLNDPLYVIVWYSVACAAVTAMARWLLPRRFHL